MNDGNKNANALIDDEEKENSSSESDSTSNGNKKESAGSDSPKTYTLPGIVDEDGNLKQLTADQVVEEAKKSRQQLTITSQELKELKSDNGNESKVDEQGLSEKDKEVIAQLIKWGFTRESAVKKMIEDKAPEIQSKSANAATAMVGIKQEVLKVTSRFDGSEEELSDGTKVKKPKVDENKLLDFMVRNPGYSALQAAKALYPDLYTEYEIKVRMAGGTKTNYQTEKQGAGEVSDQQPKKKAPSFNQPNSLEKRIADRFGVQPKVLLPR